MTTATPAKKRPARKRPAAAATTPAPAATPAKKAPARKVPAKKAPAAEVATRSSKRQDRSEGRTTPRKRVATKTAPAQDATEAPSRGRDKNLHGFVPGTDSAIIADALLSGGGDRKDVNEKAAAAVEKASGLTTREGGQKNIPSLVSGVLRRLMDAGYEVESTFRVIPPQDIQDAMKEEQKKRARADAMAARRAARAASKTSK